MTKGPQRLVLVVDPDPAAAAALGPALRREGYQLRMAQDGARALQLAVAQLPDAIVVGEGTPVVAPRTLVRILRSNPRTAPVPIVYAGSNPERVPEGASTFVRRPLNPDEVLAALRNVLGGGASTASSDRVDGSLVQLPLPDVLQMLGNNRRSGRLRITSDAARAEIAFHEGEIVDAVTNAVTGEKALFRALSLREGRFVFQPSEWSGSRRIARPVAELLLDGLRLVDETAAVASQLPARDVMVTRDPGAPGGEAGPFAEEIRELLATPQRVGDVLDRFSGTDVEGGRALAALLASGELTVSEPLPGAARDAEPFLPQPEAHALLTRLRHAAAAPGVAVGKVLLAGGDPATRRAALERLRAFPEFRPAELDDVELGTAGAFLLDDVQLDVVLLPSDPRLSPLWGVLASGAFAALVLGAADAASAALSAARVPVGWCGAPPAESRAGAGDYLGPDLAEALRALVARTLSRPRPS